MGKEELVACFRDTLEKSYCDSLKQRTECAAESNRVYREGFVSDAERHGDWDMPIEVYAGTTFDIARKYRSCRKTAVLNFANPEYPGGGVQLGAMAQEECLCRSSNLFACLNDPNVFDEYYGYHRKLQSSFYSDRLIYTKGVTVCCSGTVWRQSDRCSYRYFWFRYDNVPACDGNKSRRTAI